MDGWQLAGTILAIWFAASFVIAIGCALLGKTRKPAPQPPLSDREVDAMFDLIVDRTLRDESNGGAS